MKEDTDTGLKKRTTTLAVDIVKFAKPLSRDWGSTTRGRQIFRSGTSINANYRPAGRARSNLEFIAKSGIVEEEADETQFWLEVLVDAGVVFPDVARPLW